MLNIETFLTSVNQAWQDGDFDRLGECYHPNAVLLPPDLGPVIAGREAIVATYRDFQAATEMQDFRVLDITSYDYGATQVAHMAFSMGYSIGDRSFIDRGQDIYVISCENPDPLIVWRQQIVTASDPVPIG